MLITPVVIKNPKSGQKIQKNTENIRKNKGNSSLKIELVFVMCKIF